MAAIIRIKRSTGTSAPGTLKTGELAYSAGAGTKDNRGDRLFYGKGDDGNGNATSIVDIGGEYYAGLLSPTTLGTPQALKAIVVDSDGKLNVIDVDNININNNTISSTNTNGNIVISPNGSGVVDVDTSRIVNVTNPTSDQDAATKLYVDTVAGAKIITLTGDTGSDTVNLSDSSLDFNGGTGISTSVTNNQVTFTLDNTGVTANTYGSSTAIPVLAINAQGQVTSASTASIASTLNLAGDGASSGSVSLLDSSLSIAGGANITTTASGNGVTIALDGDVSGLTSLSVDNITIDGNTIKSTDGSNTLYIDPAPTDSDGGMLIIRGSLTVQGTTTTVNSTTVSINDKNIVLADSAANATEADGAGITVNGPTTPATITYNGSTDAWNLNKDLDLSAFSALKIGGIEVTEALEDHLVNNFFLAGEGIDLTYVDGSNTLTIAAELATVTNPGVANFDSDQMTVTSGLVSVYQLDGGTY